MTNRTVVLVLLGCALLPGLGCAAPKPPTLCAGVAACVRRRRNAGNRRRKHRNRCAVKSGYQVAPGALRCAGWNAACQQPLHPDGGTHAPDRRARQRAEHRGGSAVRTVVRPRGRYPGRLRRRHGRCYRAIWLRWPLSKKRLMVGASSTFNSAATLPTILSEFFPSYIWKNPSGQYGDNADAQRHNGARMAAGDDGSS